jgi:hypothetical protein
VCSVQGGVVTKFCIGCGLSHAPMHASSGQIVQASVLSKDAACQDMMPALRPQFQYPLHFGFVAVSLFCPSFCSGQEGVCF